MSKDVQKIQISQEKTERKRTQHIMIEQAKSSVRLAKKAKSSRLDMVHTRPDGILSDQEINKAVCVQTQEQVRPDTSHGKLKIEKNMQKNNFF
jgi:hypothetical protein